MAGLLSEAMATAARMKWKDALASERQSMLEALERIKPQLERLGTDSLADSFGAAKAASNRFEVPVAPRGSEKCSVCGSDFFDGGEAFCGICGSARPAPQPPAPQPEEVKVHSDTSFPTITPYGAENSSYGNSVTSAKANPLPDSLQELIRAERDSTEPGCACREAFRKKQSIEGDIRGFVIIGCGAVSAASDPDYFARPTKFISVDESVESDGGSIPARCVRPTGSSCGSNIRQLRVVGDVPVDGAAGEGALPGTSFSHIHGARPNRRKSGWKR